MNKLELARNAFAWVLAGLVLMPALWLLQMSLKTGIEQFEMPPKLLFVPTFENYADLLNTNFIRAIGNSTVVAISTSLLAVVFGVPGAYVLSRLRFRARDALLLWILSSRMVPPIAFGLPFFLIYRQLGWIDTIHGLILIHLTFSLSLVIWMMRTFFDALPRSVEEAAEIDGADLLKRFRLIALPLAVPGVAAAGILSFLLSWNDFFYALLLTRTDATTVPVAIVNFMNYEGWDWGRITAGSVLIMAPVLAFTLVVRNFMIAGLTAGATRG